MAPDIVVEVLSPATVHLDRGRRMQTYARYGVPEYWIVDPVEHRVEVHSLVGSVYRLAQVALRGDTVCSTLFADLKFPAARIFAAPSA